MALRAQQIAAYVLAVGASACAPGWSAGAPEPDGEGRPNVELETGDEDEGPALGECGNGLHEPGEACDDANPTWGDGCNPDCTLGGDLRWRDMIEVGNSLLTIDDVVVASDGGVVVTSRGGLEPEDRLTVAWRADGTPAWTRRPQWWGSEFSVQRQIIGASDRVVVIDPGWTLIPSDVAGEEGTYSWYLHLEELDLDGELLREHQLVLPVVGGASLGYRAELEADGSLLLMTEGEDHLTYQRLDMATGAWTVLPESELFVEGWGAIRDHEQLADGTELFLVGSDAGTLHRLYRVGADRSVAEWEVFGSDTPPSLHLRQDTVLLLHQPDFWSPPVVQQYDLSGELIDFWDMYYADEESGLFGDLADAVSTPVGLAEWIFVDRSQRQLMRQSMDGEPRWLRLLQNWDLEPRLVSSGPEFEDDFYVVGIWVDFEGERHLYVECRAP